MANPNHDPQTGEFTDGSGGGGKTGDKTTDQALSKMSPRAAKAAQLFEKRLAQAKRDFEMKRRFMRGRSAG